MKKSSLNSTIFKIIKIVKEDTQFFYDVVDSEQIGVFPYVEWSYNLTYDKGITAQHGTSRLFTKPMKSPILKKDALSIIKTKHPTFSNALTTIHTELGVDKDQLAPKIIGLIRYLLAQNIEDKDDSDIVEITNLFITDLIDGPKNFNIKVFITGIWLETELVDIGDDFLIRKPTDNDLKITMLAFQGPSHTPDLMNCGAVLEIYQRKTTETLVQSFISRLLVLLALYKTGSITSLKYSFIPESTVDSGDGYHGPLNGASHPVNYKYKVDDPDKFDLNKFLKQFDPILGHLLELSSSDSNKPITIAIERYLDSISRGQQIEGKITGAMTSFEALFLKSNERSELSHRLSQRVARILKEFGFNSLEVYNNLKKAYDVRSTFIHGSISLPSQAQSLVNLADQVIEYLRISIVLSMFCTHDSDKEKWIGLIDNAMLDDNASQKLITKLSSAKEYIFK